MWENALRTTGSFVMVNVAETLGKFQSCVKKTHKTITEAFKGKQLQVRLRGYQ